MKNYVVMHKKLNTFKQTNKIKLSDIPKIYVRNHSDGKTGDGTTIIIKYCIKHRPVNYYNCSNGRNRTFFHCPEYLSSLLPNK